MEGASRERGSTSLDDVLAAAEAMRGFGRPWWIAGGWAIDLFLDRVTRPHGDLEIGIWRDDQPRVRSVFPTRTWHFARDHQWLPWRDERLDPPLHQLKARDDATSDEVEFF